MNRRSHRKNRGFTLVELMVVCAVMVVIVALALPTMFNVMSAIRARMISGELSGLFQGCRVDAVKSNKSMTVHFTTVSGRTFAFTEEADKTPSLTDPTVHRQLVLPVGSTYFAVPSGDGAPSAMDSTALWGGTATAMSGDTSFNPRGLPCSFSSGACTTGQGSINYFKTGGALGADRWIAVTISPAGRIKTWFWTGTDWGD